MGAKYHLPIRRRHRGERVQFRALSYNSGGFGRRQLRARAMQRLTGAERQKRIELARDAALRLVRPQH